MLDRGEFESVLFDGEAAEPALLREDVGTSSLFEPAESRWDVFAPTIGALAGEAVEAGNSPTGDSPARPTGRTRPTGNAGPTGRARPTSRTEDRPRAGGMSASSSTSGVAGRPVPRGPGNAEPMTPQDWSRQHTPAPPATASAQSLLQAPPAGSDRPGGTQLDSTWLPDQRPYAVDPATQEPELEAPGNLPSDSRPAKPGSSPLAGVMMIPLLLIFWGLGPWPSAIAALMAGAAAWNRQNSARSRLVAVVILAVSLYFTLRGL